MDFGINADQQALIDLAADFARNEIAPHVERFERDEQFPRELAARMGELGLLGGTIPEAYGGLGLDYLTLALLLEELAYVDVTAAVIAGWPSCSLGRPILLYGTEEQKARYLTPLCRGQKFGAHAVTEPHSGTDIVRRLETTVRRDGDHYVLNGTKTWISNASNADFFLTYGTLDKSLGSEGDLRVLRRRRHARAVDDADPQQGGLAQPGHRAAVLRGPAHPRAEPAAARGPGLQVADVRHGDRAPRVLRARDRADPRVPRRGGRLRTRARGVRPADRPLRARAGEDRQHARRARDVAPARAPFRVAARPGRRARAEGGVDRQALHDGHADAVRAGRLPDPRRVRRGRGIQGGTLFPRREGDADLRRRERDAPADHRRMGARLSPARAASAARRPATTSTQETTT